MIRPPARTWLACALAPFTCFVTVGVPTAQSASETTLALAEGTMGVGGEAVGSVTGGVLRASVGQAFIGDEATSTNYIVHTGVAQQTPSFATNQPLLTGVRPGSADKDGSVPINLFGYNLSAVGAGATFLQFDGVQRPVTVTGNTSGTLVTPQSIDSFSNPTVDVDLRLLNNNGDYTKRDSFHNEPALLAANAAQLAHRFKMRLHADPGQIYLLIFGSSIPGFGAPVAPFDGQLMLLGPGFLFITPTPQFIDPNGLGVLEINMPSNPPLAGFPLEFQGIALDASLTSGAWTNVLTSVIQP